MIEQKVCPTCSRRVYDIRKMKRCSNNDSEVNKEKSIQIQLQDRYVNVEMIFKCPVCKQLVNVDVLAFISDLLKS